MASIQKGKNKNGTQHWRAVVRIKGYPTVCNHFDRKQEAEDWAAEVEREIKKGKFNFDQHKRQHTFIQLIERYISDGCLEHIRSADDMIHHLNYWKSRLGNYSLIYLTSELVGIERQVLANTPTPKNQKRSSATVNRYLSSLSTVLSHAVRLRWIEENPCFRLTKLKESPGRDRVLTDDEILRLLVACRQSKSPYLYCFVLMSLTTGARQGEILGIEWRHVDLENKVAHLKETKNSHPRSISLADAVIIELTQLYQIAIPPNRWCLPAKQSLAR